MKYLLALAISCLPFASYAQSFPGSVSGQITVPTLQEIGVEFLVNGFQMKFDNFDQMDEGKEYPAALKVHVKSNTPWVVKVKALDPAHQSAGGHYIPTSLVSIRPQGGVYAHMQTGDLAILQNTNTNIINDYYLDLKIDHDYNGNYVGGLYNLNVGFSISAP